MSEWKISEPIAYEGRSDCVSLLCRRFFGPDNEITPGCRGWHCAACDEPSSQYGHNECRED